MLKNQIKIGGLYLAKVSGVVTTVRVDNISTDGLGVKDRLVTKYYVTNLKTGRKTTFRSAAKFRCEAKPKEVKPEAAPSPTSEMTNSKPDTESSVQEESEVDSTEDEQCSDPTQQVQSTTQTAQTQTKSPTTGGTATDAEDHSTLSESNGTAQSVENSTQTTEVEQRLPFAMTSATVGAPTESTLPASSQDAAGASIAGRIAASMGGRTVGSPVAGMVPNEEQEAILEVAIHSGLRVLVIGAGAGTGKTATCKMLEQVLPGNGQYTAFNRPLIIEGKAKFTKAACNTTHSLAFRAVGKLYQHRLGGERMRSSQVARILGINPLTVLLRGMGAPDESGRPTDKQKVMQADFLAGQVTVAIRRFCQSDDLEVHTKHFRYIDGIDKPGERENNDHVREYLLGFARKMWDDLTKVNGQLPFNHDVYVKLWQLGEGADRPIISADYILLDEAQDTAPVFLDVIRRQEHALLVLVGDSNQQIYEWRGAVDAMRAFPDAPRRLLSQSYRFGQAIADVANTILATLDEPTDLVMRGMPGLPSRVDVVEEPRCYLYRTNAGAVSRVMVSKVAGKKPYLIGGGADVVAWCQAAMDLQSKRGTRHPELCCFDDWNEVVEYSKTDEGSEARLMVKLITEFGAEEIRDALKDMPPEDEADLVCSTAHKSKGREWDTVKLGPDFPLINKMSDSDRRLLYVAATRAKLTLDVSECPPFCGGNDTRDTGNPERSGGFVRGFQIIYTQPMPTKEEQDQWIKSRKNLIPQQQTNSAEQKSASPTTATAVDTADSGTSQTIPNSGAQSPATGSSNGDFIWTKFQDKWCICGAAGVELGKPVKVKRKDGSSAMVTPKSVVHKYTRVDKKPYQTEKWVYSV